jgi:uncharacterized protein YndB with AHSA1/START domain
MAKLKGAPVSDGEWSVDIDATPERVWSVVSDPTRTPEWSPVCHTVDWIGELHAPEVGAKFRGQNKLNGARWSRECRVTALDSNRSFAWSTYVKGNESTRWRYDLEPMGANNTRLTESYEIVSAPRWVRAMWLIPGGRAKSQRDTERNVGTSLQRIKEIAEDGQS